MRKMMIIAVIMLSGMSFGQTIEPKLEAVGKLVKATYYYENGKVQQEGYFNDGKLDGKWTSYTTDGSIQAVAEYTNGVKSGSWHYFENNVAVNDVVYSDNQIASVTILKENRIANTN